MKNTKNVIKRVLLALAVLALLLITPDLIGLGVASLSIQNMARQTVRYTTTGMYNKQYCEDLDANNTPCYGKSKNKEVNTARLTSIHAIASKEQGPLQVNANAVWNQSGYLHVIVCSAMRSPKPPLTRRPNAVANMPRQGGFDAASYADCTLDNHEVEDPGYSSWYPDFTDSWVVVMVDYNYPFWLPILRSLWPYFHLTATSEALMEKYR